MYTILLTFLNWMKIKHLDHCALKLYLHYVDLVTIYRLDIEEFHGYIFILCYRQIGYEELSSSICGSKGEFLDYTLFDEHFIFYSKHGTMMVPTLTPTFICNDFKILILYEYDKLSTVKPIERDDLLFIYEKNICSLFDILDPRIDVKIKYIKHLTIYRDIVEKCHNNYKQRIAFYPNQFLVWRDRESLVKIEGTSFYYDIRNNYALKNNQHELNLVGIYDNKKIRKLTKIEGVVARLQDTLSSRSIYKIKIII